MGTSQGWFSYVFLFLDIHTLYKHSFSLCLQCNKAYFLKVEKTFIYRSVSEILFDFFFFNISKPTILIWVWYCICYIFSISIDSLYVHYDRVYAWPNMDEYVGQGLLNFLYDFFFILLFSWPLTNWKIFYIWIFCLPI